jgi:hypothetical protein
MILVLNAKVALSIFDAYILLVFEMYHLFGCWNESNEYL